MAQSNPATSRIAPVPASEEVKRLRVVSPHRAEALDLFERDGTLQALARRLSDELVEAWWHSRERGRMQPYQLADKRAARERTIEGVREVVVDYLETLIDDETRS